MDVRATAPVEIASQARWTEGSRLSTQAPAASPVLAPGAGVRARPSVDRLALQGPQGPAQAGAHAMQPASPTEEFWRTFGHLRQRSWQWLSQCWRPRRVRLPEEGERPLRAGAPPRPRAARPPPPVTPIQILQPSLIGQLPAWARSALDRSGHQIALDAALMTALLTVAPAAAQRSALLAWLLQEGPFTFALDREAEQLLWQALDGNEENDLLRRLLQQLRASPLDAWLLLHGRKGAANEAILAAQAAEAQAQAPSTGAWLRSSALQDVARLEQCAVLADGRLLRLWDYPNSRQVPSMDPVGFQENVRHMDLEICLLRRSRREDATQRSAGPRSEPVSMPVAGAPELLLSSSPSSWHRAAVHYEPEMPRSFGSAGVRVRNEGTLASTSVGWGSRLRAPVLATIVLPRGAVIYRTKLGDAYFVAPTLQPNRARAERPAQTLAGVYGWFAMARQRSLPMRAAPLRPTDAPLA